MNRYTIVVKGDEIRYIDNESGLEVEDEAVDLSTEEAEPLNDLELGN